MRVCTKPSFTPKSRTPHPHVTRANWRDKPQRIRLTTTPGAQEPLHRIRPKIASRRAVQYASFTCRHIDPAASHPPTFESWIMRLDWVDPGRVGDRPKRSSTDMAAGAAKLPYPKTAGIRCHTTRFHLDAD